MLRPVIVLMLLTGCGALTAELDEPRVCQDLPAVVIPGVGADDLSAQLNLSLPVSLPLSGPGVSHLALDLTQVTLSAAADGGTLGNLTAAEVVILPPGASGADGGGVVALDYTGSADEPQPDPLVLTGNGVNLAPYLSNDALAAQLRVQGSLPATSWTMDVQVCFRVTATVNYAAAATE